MPSLAPLLLCLPSALWAAPEKLALPAERPSLDLPLPAAGAPLAARAAAAAAASEAAPPQAAAPDFRAEAETAARAEVLFDDVYREVRADWARGATVADAAAAWLPQRARRALATRAATRLYESRLAEATRRHLGRLEYVHEQRERRRHNDGITGLPSLEDAPLATLGPVIDGGRDVEVYREKDDPSFVAKVYRLQHYDEHMPRHAALLDWLARRGAAVEPARLARLPNGRPAMLQRYLSSEDGWHSLHAYSSVADPQAYAEAHERGWAILNAVDDLLRRADIRFVGTDRSKAWVVNTFVNARTKAVVNIDPINRP